MNNQTLIVYQFTTLHQILKELENNLNFNIIEVDSRELLQNKIKNFKNYLIITKEKISYLDHQVTFNSLPKKIVKLIEIINVEFMKKHFNNQSKLKINNYLININSREMMLNDLKLKLTEKEINTIIYLSKINKAVSIEELEKNVWQYQPDIETHTVETHIYRLRKKISQKFKDDKFIISKKNGYQVSEKKSSY